MFPEDTSPTPVSLDRRTFLRHAALGGAGLALAPLLGCASKGSPMTGPNGKPMNVLFIAIDDLNDWLGCYGGHPQVHSPHIDRLAGESVLFERPYCPAPICNPCRVAMLTGHRPSATGIYNNHAPLFREFDHLREVVTLPGYFKQHGYRTYGGGKIFHSPSRQIHDPQSWTRYYQEKAGTPWPAGDFPKVPWPGKGARSRFWFWGPIDTPKEETEDWRTADLAGRLLQEQTGGQPFFIAAGIARPHLPFFAPQEFFDLYPLDSIQLPPIYQNDLDDIRGGRKRAEHSSHKILVESGHWHRAVQAYLASISFADACVGHLLQALDNSPHRDNTMVVLWSDHGYHLGEKEHWAKYTLWEEANHCPLIIRLPGVTPAGSRCPHPVSLQDLYPTLLSACGLPPRENLDGHDLMPLLRNPQAEWSIPALMTHGYNNHGVRSHEWTYLRYDDGDEELYNFRHDPQEWHNLAADPQYAAVKEELGRWMPTENHPEVPSQRHLFRDEEDSD